MSFILLHRKLRDHPFWTDERFTRGQAWVDLIFRASYTDHLVVQGNRALQVQRGQVLTSQVALARAWRWNRETVRAFLRLLESLNMAAIETSKASDTGYTLITLRNYALYQGETSLGPTCPQDSAIQAAIDEPTKRHTRQGESEVTSTGSAIETSFDPASTQHPTATFNKGNKGNKTLAGDSAPAGALCPPMASKGGGRGGRHKDPNVRRIIDTYHAAFTAGSGALRRSPVRSTGPSPSAS